MYYLAMFLGYVAMVVLMLRRDRRARYRLSKTRAVLFATAVLLAGILGCKILYILENLRFVQQNGLTLGGFSFFGAALLAPLAMLCLGRVFRLRSAEALDNTAVCIVTMLAVIRIGCFCNGCCGGRIFFFESFDFSFPTQLMESFCDFLILLWLLRTESASANCGRLYGRFLLSYGVLRFFLEFLRSTPKDWWGLSHAQWFSLLAVVIGGSLELNKLLKSRAKSAA